MSRLPIVASRRWRGGHFAASAGGGAGAGGGASGPIREDDLVVWYKFDEGTGTAVADSSDSEFDATLAGGVSWATGKNHGALSFDGTDDKLTCDAATYAVADAMNAHATDATANGAWSVSFWLKYESYGSGWAEGIFNIGNENAGNEWLNFWMRADPSGNGDVYQRMAYRTGGAYFDTPSFTPDSDFHHWAVTFDGSDWVTYKDGSSVATVTHGMRYGRTNTGEGLHIGRSYGYTAMEIEDFRIYNIALTEGNVYSIYNSGDSDW